MIANHRRCWQTAGGLLVVAIVAGLFRFLWLSDLPPGLHFDEAFHQVNALHIYWGKFPPVFYTGNFGVEPLHSYLTGVFFILFGPTPIAGRLVSAGAGVLTVVTLYFVVQELFLDLHPRALRRLGLLCSLILGTWYWHFFYSRLGIEPVLVPLVASLAVLFVWRMFRSGSSLHAALAGAFAGLGLYTYPAGRMIPLIIGSGIVYQLTVVRRAFRRALLLGALATGVGVIVFLPLGFFFLQNPHWFLLRAAQVTGATIGDSATGPWAQLWEGFADTARGLFWQGDGNWRQNLPSRPAFDVLQSVFFVLGLSVCVRRWKQGGRWFVPVWAAFGLLPTVVTEYPPHFGRALGATPPLAILAGLGMWSVAGWIKSALSLSGVQTSEVSEARLLARLWSIVRVFWSRGVAQRLPKSYGLLAAALVVGLSWATSTGWAFRDYFHVWARSSELFIAFDVGLRSIGEYVSQLPAEEPVYLTPVPNDLYTLAYFVEDDSSRLRSFNGRECLVLPDEAATPTHVIVIVQEGEDNRSLDRLASLYPDGRVVWQVYNRDVVYAVDFEIPAGATAVPPVERPLRASLDDRVALLGYDVNSALLRPGETLTVRLLWQGLETMTMDYTVFVHLVGSESRADGTQSIWAQRDARPCNHSYLTNRWQPGELVWDDYRLTLPADIPPDDYTLHVGMYELASGVRLPVAASSAQMGDDVLLETITVQSSP